MTEASVGRSWAVALLALMLGGCGPDLTVGRGARGNLTGVWIAEAIEVGAMSVNAVLWLEQIDVRVAGVAICDAPSDLAQVADPQPVPRDESCNVDVELQDDVLGFRLPAPAYVPDLDLLVRLTLDRQRDVLVGRWGADVALDVSGPVELRRASWLPLREPANEVGSSGGPQLLDCLDRVLPQCGDGRDNDGDGKTDDEDEGCLLSRLSPDDTWPRLRNNEGLAPWCSDGIDNDTDGKIDGDDADCLAQRVAELGFRSAFACSDGRDNDGDGMTDLDDPGCAADPRASTEVGPICADGVDNDRDGLTDGDDPECADGGVDEHASHVAACANGYDDDGDGLVDLLDPQCHKKPRGNSEASTDSCDDGVDNDGDGLTDLEEEGCSVFWNTLTENGSGSCEDGLDNDADGLADGDDPDCIFQQIGEEGPTVNVWEAAAQLIVVGNCTNGIDDDDDGLTDAEDPGCAVAVSAYAVPPSRPWCFNAVCDIRHVGFENVPPCIDGLDNDGDGSIDMQDPQCDSPLATSEAAECENNVDDDGDGLTDGDDPACARSDADGRELQPECADGIDNDGDGAIDEDDPHCTSSLDNWESAACRDGMDNDNDLLFDGADPQCENGSDDDEAS